MKPFHIDSTEGGIARNLAEGISTTVFPGQQAMVSVVRLDANAQGTRHSHPEEQWGYLLEGSLTRYQGDDVLEVEAGHFWCTPGGVEHTVKAGPDGAVVLDFFAPMRQEYLKPGEGFGS